MQGSLWYSTAMRTMDWPRPELEAGRDLVHLSGLAKCDRGLSWGSNSRDGKSIDHPDILKCGIATT